MYKSFSLIELIFSILIIAIISSIAIPKLLNTNKPISILKVKNDLLLIQNALLEYKNKKILQNETIDLTVLDDGNHLFSYILPNHSFFNKKEIHHWEKISNNQYNFWLTNKTSILFIYNSTNLSFMCDKNMEQCQEILQ